MTLWIDIKYADLLSSRLEKFSVKTRDPYYVNFRCPYCGDSQKNPNKKRGWIYSGHGKLFFRCFNCEKRTTFQSFLKDVSSQLFDDYKLERYRNEEGEAPEPVTEEPKKSVREGIESIFTRMDGMMVDPRAVEYCRSRRIPLEGLLFIDDMRKVTRYLPGLKFRDEPRVVFPFYKEGKMVGFNAREYLGGNGIRYISVRLEGSELPPFNVDRVTDGTVYVFEGPIDSLMVRNGIAVANADLRKSSRYLDKDRLILVWDNQPRNQDVVKMMTRACSEGYRVFVWPSWISEKDVNEYVVKNPGTDVEHLINSHAYRNLSLMNEISRWKKITNKGDSKVVSRYRLPEPHTPQDICPVERGREQEGKVG